MKVYVLEGEEAMSLTEVKPVDIEVLDLRDGETVESATVTHTPPSGETPITITPTVGASYVDLLLGPFGVAGWHFVKVQAVGNGSPPSKPEVLYAIQVKDI